MRATLIMETSHQEREKELKTLSGRYNKKTYFKLTEMKEGRSEVLWNVLKAHGINDMTLNKYQHSA